MKKEPTYFASPVPNFYEEPPFMMEFKRFHYEWKHITTGANGKSFVWCNNRNKFLELLSYWNKDERWRYSEI